MELLTSGDIMTRVHTREGNVKVKEVKVSRKTQIVSGTTSW